ncbi:hypothetical protein KVR01_010123 [Diaporthe batatas]|uniref:uncharacterized protein n=1 Tax=Diaporthe batatas TaxID=748121 RepID=UPI001D043491|nr:uncharacterized protein KVR01_010123 [Diaporthe batatas]KAG8160587.1 hypothetical protein KVR01_010123 [Diaporthe batatas]
MDLTPPLTKSPASTPKTYCPSETSSSDYPSPDLVEQHYRISSIYESDAPCSMAPENSLPPLDGLAQGEWNPAAALHPSLTTASMSSVLSAEYDPFAAYGGSVPGPYTHDMYGSNSHTPPQTMAASRSPDPSLRRSSLAYTHLPAASSPTTPRIKAETPSEYEQTESSHYPSPRITNAPYSTNMGSYPSLPSLGQPAMQSASGYASEGPVTAWTKPDEYPLEPERFYLTTGSQSPAAVFGQQEARRPGRLGSRSKRAPRKLTTKEEANFQCDVEGCGKLFSRSYNFKAHMETHDEKREYHFPCQVEACTKKFVRKTDLQRHHQSVHVKERNHKCDYCARMFARKDTLRRHMDDGCSKRFDIGTLDLRPSDEDNDSRTLPPLTIPPLSRGSSEVNSNYSWAR